MKKLFLIFFIVFASGTAFSQNWTTIDYTYGSGPVSPEYQYSYQIIINSNGSGTVIYTKNTSNTENTFRIGRNGLSRLNAALNKSQVLTVNPDDMKSANPIVGGKSRSLKISLPQPPNTDQPPQVITVPSQLNSTYSAGVMNLYYVIEMLVPPSVWNKTTN